MYCLFKKNENKQNEAGVGPFKKPSKVQTWRKRIMIVGIRFVLVVVAKWFHAAIHLYFNITMNQSYEQKYDLAKLEANSS